MSAKIRSRFFTAVGIGLLILTACAPPPPPGRVYVVDRPPPARVEVIPVTPGREFVWVGGYWRRIGTRWDWAPGHYVRREGGRRWYRRTGFMTGGDGISLRADGDRMAEAQLIWECELKDRLAAA